MKKNTALGLMGGIIVSAGIYLAATSGITPVPEVQMSLPWNHNMFEGQQIPGGSVAFSGKWLVHAQQWGAYAIDTTKATWTGGSGTMVSPLTVGPGFQPPAFCAGNGDTHQSAQWIVASPGTPKWVVTTEPSLGSFGQCSNGKIPSPLQVYQLGDATGLRYVGQAFAGNTFAAGSRIIGDLLYANQGAMYAIVNLNDLTAPAGSTFTPPPFTPQPDIGGFTFTLTKLDNFHYRLNRVGGPSVTPTALPPPTPPQATNPYADYVEAMATAKIMNGCGPDVWCPKGTVTREQLAVILWKSSHPGGALPPKCVGKFLDVPCVLGGQP